MYILFLRNHLYDGLFENDEYILRTCSQEAV